MVVMVTIFSSVTLKKFKQVKVRLTILDIKVTLNIIVIIKVYGTHN